jgi:membrane protein
MRVKDEISRTNLSLIAAGVAFYAFLAIPSAFAALIALYGLAFDPAEVGRQVQGMRGVLPAEAIKLLSAQLQDLTSHSSATLGIGFAVSLGIALWSARSATSSMIAALNIAYGEQEKRGLFRLQFAALGLTAGGVLFAVVSLALVAVLPAVLDLLPLEELSKTLASVIRWPVLLALVMVAMAALYRFAPCREEPRWRWVSWGAVAATMLWLIGSALFSLYVGEFASYDKSYGSLGAVVVLLMWLYLSIFALLFGAKLNAEIEHQTARDSTTGRPLPMGRRGARMADTLGATQ